MGLNLFIAVICVVVALLLTFLTIRFFFGARARATDAETGAFRDQPEQEPVHAGDTLRTRRSDNAASIRLLTTQVVVAAVLTLLVIIPDLLHMMRPSRRGCRRSSSRRSCSTAATRSTSTAGRRSAGACRT